MNKSCFSDDSHFEVHGLKSQYEDEVLENPSIPFIFYRPRNTP